MKNMKTVLKTLRATAVKGFSLIEVLVAMTILSVIVLIVAGIFQQTGLAWSLGLRRAESQSVIRAVAGALTRDLAMMVDPAHFAYALPSASTRDYASSELNAWMLDEEVNIANNRFAFWILKPSDDVMEDNECARELCFVEYSGGNNLTRKEMTFNDSNTWEESGDTSFKLSGSGSDGSVKFEPLNYSEGEGHESFYEDAGIKITIQPSTPATINDYEIAVGSCGPDGKWGTEDDIRSWVEGEDSK